MRSHFATLRPGARLYVTAVVCLGLAAILHSLAEITREPIGWRWTILAVLTLVSGSATVRLPSLPATISVSETFVFTSVLLFGPAAGTLTVALDALVISLWAYKRREQAPYKCLFNVTALAATIWIASQLFFFAAGTDPLALAPKSAIGLQHLVAPLILFTVAYFLLNSWIITFAISLERGLPPIKIWRDHFVWLALNYFGGASIAALLVSYTRELDFTYLAVIVPLLLVLYFTFSTSMGRVEDANRHVNQLNTLYMSTIETLAMAIDAKDQITHGHIRRVQKYAVALAAAMGVKGTLLIKAIEAAALLHDMGKLAVPEYILNKPGPLTPAEFDKMKIHASVGADILSAIDFPYPVVPIVRHHHENWDGTGYPDGLSGTDIPIGARILSVVDCFDALTSDRPYRPRLSDGEALKILNDRRGSMYDPLVVDTFIEVHRSLAPQDERGTSSAPLRAIADAATPRSTRPHRRLDEISGSSDETLTLFRLSRELNSATSPEDSFRIAAKHLRRLVPSSLVVFFRYAADTDELWAVQADGEESAVVLGQRIAMGERLSGWVAANRHTIRNSDAVLDLGETARAIHPRLHSCLATPLVADGNLVGVLTQYSPSPEAFSEEHQRVCEVVARQLASSLQRTALTHNNQHGSNKISYRQLPRYSDLLEIAPKCFAEATPDNPVSIIRLKAGGHPHLTNNRAHGQSSMLMDRLVEIVRISLSASASLFQDTENQVWVLLPDTSRADAQQFLRVVEDAMASHFESASGLPRCQISGIVVSAPVDGTSVEVLLARLNKQGWPQHQTGDSGSIH